MHSGHQPSLNGNLDLFAPEFLPDDPCTGEAAASRERVLAEIERLGLWKSIRDLEVDGYTILSPQQAGSPELVAPLREKIVAISQRRAGIAIDIHRGRSHADIDSPHGSVQMESALLLEDPIFEQALMNEPVLALITYLLGESCILNHLSSMVKGPGGKYLPIHTDQERSGSPAPFPPFSQVANATWALTDYSPENGSTCFVPGSHKFCRGPTLAEVTDLARYHPVTCPAGSILIWHGNTWHGSVPRRIDGNRVSLVGYYSRWYYPPFDDLSRKITPAMLARNPARFGILTGATQDMWDAQRAKFNGARFGLYA